MSSEVALTVPGWLVDLQLADRTSGGRPEIPPTLLAEAREWLTTILVDVADGLVPHIRQLERFYNGKFQVPISRCLMPNGIPDWPTFDPRFRHNAQLDELQTTALSNTGLSALKNTALFPTGEAAEIARLLLNPYALFALSDLITCSVPDAWQDRIEESGRRLVSQLNLELPSEE